MKPMDKALFQKQVLSLLDEKCTRPIKERLEAFQHLESCIQNSLQTNVSQNQENAYNESGAKKTEPVHLASRLGRNKSHEQSETLTKALEKIRSKKSNYWSGRILRPNDPESSQS